MKIIIRPASDFYSADLLRESDYAAVWAADENTYCALCECYNGHSLSCPTIAKDAIETEWYDDTPMEYPEDPEAPKRRYPTIDKLLNRNRNKEK